MSVNSTINDPLYKCSPVAFYTVVVIQSVKTILLLPVSTLVLYLGVQRWRQRSSKPASHSDVFTYHLAVMELIGVFGIIFYIYGTFNNHTGITTFGSCAISAVFYGEMFFHLLTCVERYLAVVHPITYVGLRNARGVRIRNISVGCVWLLCFGLLGQMKLFISHITIPFLFFLALFILIISFCSFSVLFVLIRSGPVKEGQKTHWVDQSKQRAFHTITAILTVLLLWFVGSLVSFSLVESPLLSYSVTCVVMVAVGWFNLPSSLVLPLLYLHRAGKLPGCKHNTESR